MPWPLHGCTPHAGLLVQAQGVTPGSSSGQLRLRECVCQDDPVEHFTEEVGMGGTGGTGGTGHGIS